MTELFVPYDEALELKNLEFDEQCLARYNVSGDLITTGCYSDSHPVHLAVEQADICEAHILAPLWSQAFKFFRDEHKLDSFCRTTESSGRSYWKISKLYDDGKIKGYSGFTNTYEEAQLECLRQLIKLCKK